MHHYSWHPKDYMADTAHLDDLEDLAYRRMLDWQYLNESPLPKEIDKIAKLIRMRMEGDRIKLVLDEFYTLTGNGWENHRVSSELQRIYDKSEKARESANKRWERKNANAMRTHSEGNANGMLPNTQYPIPTTQDPPPNPGSPKQEGASLVPSSTYTQSLDGDKIQFDSETGEVVAWR